MAMNLDDLLKNPKHDGTDGDPRDWSKPSLAVIAYTPRKFGTVLWFVGAHVESMIEQIGAHDIDELGFEGDPPIGLSIWEGTTVGGGYNSQGDYDDCYLRGTYRAPTEDEWAAIRAGRCPWDPDQWLREVESTCLDCGAVGLHHCEGVPGGFPEEES